MQPAEEWLRQADYDVETAESMLRTGRYIYAVFMCHQSVERALKGVVRKTTGEYPPRTHNLIQLIERANLDIPENVGRFLSRLNEARIATRYPEDLAKALAQYPETIVRDVVKSTHEALQWIRQAY